MNASTGQTVEAVTPGDELRWYFGERAVRCPVCGHVSPSQELLERHLIRVCCGLAGMVT
jgi:hypothetical protein